MSIERCAICNDAIDTDFEDGAYDARGRFICEQCAERDEDEPADDCDALAAEAAYHDQDQQDREAYLNGYPDPRRRAWWRAP